MLHTNQADRRPQPQHTTHAVRINRGFDTEHGTRNTQYASRLLLLLILLVALFLRIYRLSEVPAGVDYDEAGNFILAGEIAAGQSRPIFIRAYAGREAVFYWLAAGSMRLLGRSLFAFRLAAALCGVGAVLLAYLFARELFAHETCDEDDVYGGGGVFPPLSAKTPSLGGRTPPLRAPSLGAMTLPLLTAALMAVSYWQVHVSRYGFRVNAMVLLLTAMMVWLWRGLRRDNWWDLVLAGVLCGLSANTYLAVRAFPLVLLVLAVWVIFTWRYKAPLAPEGRSPRARGEGGSEEEASPDERRSSRAGGEGGSEEEASPDERRSPRARGEGKGRAHGRRVAQFAVFGLAALAAFAPLGLFFLRNPEYFSTRMGQTSVFDPEIHGGDLWGTLGRVTLDALGIFTVRGDGNPVYNYAQKPIYGPVLGACFYVGLGVCLWRLLRRGGSLQDRTPYLLLLVWLPVMLVPNVLGARGVPHSLRSMGIIPAVYIVAALGIVVLIRAGERLLLKIGRLVGWKAKGSGKEPEETHDGEIAATIGATHERTCIAPGAAKKPGFSLRRWVGPALVLFLLVLGGAQSYHRYFDLWAHDAGVYYGTAADVRHAAEYLSGWDADEVTLYVSNDTYRHTTIAAFATNYDRLKWVSEATLVLPVESERPALYVFDHTNPLDPVLARSLPAGSLVHRELGPDGRVGFEAYLVPPEQMPTPRPQALGQGNLGSVLAFLGYDLNALPASGDTLDVTLYWRVLAPVDREDWTFFAHLVDDLGFRWGGETFFNYPSSQWAPGEVILYRKRIPVAPGAPPGPYTLDLGVFSPSLDARLPALNEGSNGARQLAGTTVRAGAIDVGRAPAPPEELPPIQQPLQARFGEALAYLGSDRDRSDLRPGETLALSLYWLLESETAEPHAVSLWLEGGGGRLPLWEGSPAQGRYPFARWQPPEFVRDRYALRVPLDAEARDYDLRLALLGRDGKAIQVSPTIVGLTTDTPAHNGSSGRGPDSGRADSRRSLSLGVIHIQASDRLWEPPAFEQAVGARLGDSVELLGYDLDVPEGRTVQPGDTIGLTLIWRCLREMEASYTVFTHLLDEGDQIRGQQDNPPVDGRYPTTLWAPGEVIVDEYSIAVQPDAPEGTYVVEVGMYDPATMQRLPVLDPTGAVGDRVLLGSVGMGRLGD